MRNTLWITVWLFVVGLGLSITGCGMSSTAIAISHVTTYNLTVGSTNPGIGMMIAVSPVDLNHASSGATTFARTYDAGTSVTLTAPSTSGPNVFSSWSGCTTSSAVSCNVALNSNTTVTANYTTPPDTPTYVLTVDSTNPNTGVAIDVSLADNNQAANGSTSFTRTYYTGTSVALTAPATSGGNVFSSWTGCTSSSTMTCTVAMNSNATVTANYEAPSTTAQTYSLAVNSTNPGSGVAIGVSPLDNNQAANGATSFTRTYNAGTSVTLTAPANSGGNIFSSWTGCTTSSTTSCTVALNTNASVTANYITTTTTSKTYALTVNSTNPASGVTVGVSPADNNQAANGSTSFTRTYDSGTAVTLTAPATSGANTFASWTGCTTSSTTTCTIALNTNSTVTANYTTPAAATYALTVNSIDPASGVAIGVSPADNHHVANGSTSFTRTYNTGTAVTLTAPASVGANIFSSWTGCTTSSTTTCTIALNTNSTVTANYTAPAAVTYALTVNSANPASGVAIGVSPADNNHASNGPTSFTRTYNSGTTVTLTAPATSGANTFSAWTGCATSSTTTCTVTLNANTTVTANYTTPTSTSYSLTVNSSDPASGIAIGVSPADQDNAANGTTSFIRTYISGTSVTLTAPPASGGNPFSSWSGCSTSTTLTCTVTLNSNTTVTANYTTPATPVYSLTVDSENPGAGVGINVAPEDNDHATNGSTSFTRTYSDGTAVTLTAPASAFGNPFVDWTGCTTTTALTCTVTVNSDTTVTAHYMIPPPTPITYLLKVNSKNPASGVAIDVSPQDNTNATNGDTSFTRTYNTGTVVTLTAPATSGGNNFSSWTGCATASTVTCTVTLNTNTTVVANYAPPPPPTYTLTVDSTSPASGVAVGVSPADTNNASAGTTSFTRTYNAGTNITLTAPSTSSGNTFSSWTGCTTANAASCTVVLNANTKVTAYYVGAAPTTYQLTVDSTNPASGVAIGVTPGDNNNATNGSTSFNRTYNSGTAVTLTAPATSGSNTFNSWSGCTSANGATCSVTMNVNATVTANYTKPSTSGVVVSPNPVSVVIGLTQQFTATINGTPSTAVTWSVAASSGSSLSPGTITSSGLYTTPYPAPATVTVTATSKQAPTESGSATVTLVPPAASSGPALTVDAGNQTRSISPNIYGMNGYELDYSAAKAANIPLVRWGGDAASRYNYQLDVTNTAADEYFENRTGNIADGQSPVNGKSAFNALVANDQSIGAATLGTVPVLGWVAKDSTTCSYPTSTYPNQYSTDYWFPDCGDGENSNQSFITTANPSSTSVPVGPSWSGQWVNSLVSTFGTAANGGVAYYELDNEPSWWDDNHRDVHPEPSTYDEVTNNGLATAEAIKAADPTAQTNGPIVDYWWNYFYSKKDIESGWAESPCGLPWANPVDRNAHGGVPFIEYYLQQFAAYQAANKVRLLDYLDLHGYFAAYYPLGSGNQVGSTTAGDTGEQQARLNSTRALWDPNYTDSHYNAPNYPTDPGYTTDYCIVPLQAPQLIPMMHNWIAKDYPGTKTAISEYNWGGQESINGAVTQADILGIFGSYGLDMATLWGPPNPSTQLPGLMAYEIYRNYDGKDSLFGNQALASISAEQGQLSVYGALRTSDNAITIVIINKTYGDLTSTLSLANFSATPGQTAQAFLYSNSNLNAIVSDAPVPLTQPGSGGTASTLTTTFPAQSITLLVIK
jgi:hypothetical protein